MDCRVTYTNYNSSLKFYKQNKRAIFTIKTQFIHYSKISIKKKDFITNKQQIWDLFINTIWDNFYSISRKNTDLNQMSKNYQNIEFLLHVLQRQRKYFFSMKKKKLLYKCLHLLLIYRWYIIYSFIHYDKSKDFGNCVKKENNWSSNFVTYM